MGAQCGGAGHCCAMGAAQAGRAADDAEDGGDCCLSPSFTDERQAAIKVQGAAHLYALPVLQPRHFLKRGAAATEHLRAACLRAAWGEEVIRQSTNAWSSSPNADEAEALTHAPSSSGSCGGAGESGEEAASERHGSEGRRRERDQDQAQDDGESDGERGPQRPTGTEQEGRESLPCLLTSKTALSAAMSSNLGREFDKAETSEPVRFRVLIERTSTQDFLGLDVTGMPGGLLEVVRIDPEGLAAAAQMFKLGDVIQRVNGVGGGGGEGGDAGSVGAPMVRECEEAADLSFEVLRPRKGALGLSLALQRGCRPQVPPLKLPRHQGSPRAGRRRWAAGGGRGQGQDFRAGGAQRAPPSPRGVHGAPMGVTPTFGGCVASSP